MEGEGREGEEGDVKQGREEGQGSKNWGKMGEREREGNFLSPRR